MTAPYTVSIPAFEGPFDLLLQLIARRKVDVWEVPLAQITEDYLTVLAAMERLDLEVTTEFLVMAATLMELKAARLLPDETDPETEEQAVEVRDLLYARLLDYRTFKHAAGWLDQRLTEQAGHVPREVGLEAPLTELRPPVHLGVDAQRLAAIAANAFASTPEPEVDTSHLQPVHLTVREAAGMVVDELARAGGAAQFGELTAGCRHRVEVIVHFLALLELYKLGVVELDQPRSFGTLSVRWELDVPPSRSALAAAELTEAAPDVWTADAPAPPPVDDEEAVELPDEELTGELADAGDDQAPVEDPGGEEL